MRTAVIVDMDGTLVDVRSIRRYVSGPPAPRNFAAFHRASIDCPPNPEVVAEVRAHASRGREIVVVTARARRWERLSSMWLQSTLSHPTRFSCGGISTSGPTTW